MICEITDDGENYSERHVKRITPRNHQPFYGLPAVIEELYLEDGVEKLIKKTELTYDNHGNIASKTLYGSDIQTHYTVSTIYNKKRSTH